MAWLCKNSGEEDLSNDAPLLWLLYRGIFHYLPFLTLVVKTRDSVSCSWLRFFPVGPSCHFPSVSDGNKYNVQIIMRVDSLFFDTGFSIAHEVRWHSANTNINSRFRPSGIGFLLKF